MKLNNFRKNTLAAAIFAGLAFSSVASQAATISTLFSPGINTAQDSDAERVLNSSGAVKTSGAYAVGDAIESIIRFDTVNADSIGDSLPSPYQFTAYSKLVISKIDLLADNDSSGDVSFGDGIRLHFGNGDGTLGTADDILATLYENLGTAADRLVFGNSAATSIAKVQAQSFIADIGLGEADDFWYADTINSAALNIPLASGQLAAGVFGLSIINGASNLPIIKNGIVSSIDGKSHDIVGDASVFSRETGVNTDWAVSSNINASFTVPEPATLALLGAGLMGIGASSMRRRRKA